MFRAKRNRYSYIIVKRRLGHSPYDIHDIAWPRKCENNSDAIELSWVAPGCANACRPSYFVVDIS